MRKIWGNFRRMLKVSVQPTMIRLTIPKVGLSPVFFNSGLYSETR